MFPEDSFVDMLTNRKQQIKLVAITILGLAGGIVPFRSVSAQVQDTEHIQVKSLSVTGHLHAAPVLCNWQAVLRELLCRKYLADKQKRMIV